MIARRLTLTILASLCVLAGALAAGAVAAGAGTHFGRSGEQGGQIRSSDGIALDHSGDVYVSDEQNRRVDRFDGSGVFTMAWGRGVNGVASANELQTCTTFCQGGSEGSGSGEFAGEGPRGVAIDNDPLSSSYGDVYVVDWEGFRVEKFDSSGQFLLMFGKGVNATSGGNVCVAGEACKDGTQGSAVGQFDWSYRGSYIAVGPGGSVYVGDKARVQVFEPSGVWRESVSLSALSSEGQVSALAVNSSGDMFVKDEGVAGVREFEPGGVEKSTRFDAGSESVASIALDASGDLFVSDSSGSPHFVKYDPSGKELASFGGTTLTSIMAGMAFSDTLNELYVYGRSSSGESGVWVFLVPGAGPVIDSESATAGLRGKASLEAQVDPEGNKTSYHFEYVDEAHFQTNGYAGASSTPSASLESSFEDQPVSVQLTGQAAGVTYHYRVVATDSLGHTTTGADQSFEEIQPALVEGPWVANVASTSATLAAQIDPLGASTEYRLEYGAGTSYGHVLASGNVGEGAGYVLVTHHVQELEPGTTYHYRVVTISAVGTVESTDHTFTTQIAGSQELTLPDERAWELVSPTAKNGALIDPRLYGGVVSIQAASDGGAMSYTASLPVGEHPVGNSAPTQVLSVRGVDGWHSQDVTIPVAKQGNEDGPEYRLFSSDLSSAVVEPSLNTEVAAPLSPEATERTPYLRDNADGTFLPLVTSANVYPPGAKFGAATGAIPGEIVLLYSSELKFLSATPDLTHIILRSPFALTPEAIDGLCSALGCDEHQNLYEWGSGQLQLVNILPDGHPAQEAALGVDGFVMANTVSSDGRRVVWQSSYLVGRGVQIAESLYVRDMVEKKTVRIGGAYPLFETMSSNGSKVFFLEKGGSYESGDLYVFDWNTGTTTDVTANHGAGEDADVQDAVMGRSEDGSSVYFVATGVLAKGAVNGQHNMYVSHKNGGGWTTTYIASLSPEDEKDWYSQGGSIVVDRSKVSSHVSPDGRYIAFMSARSLTGYDNRDAVSGQPDEEVYLYDAVAGRLVCASCNRTGARPVGVHDEFRAQSLLMSVDGFWDGHWLAGSIPGWHNGSSNSAVTQEPHVVFDSGRLIFDSTDALVPQDTNGLADAYEYEPAGVGNCTSASPTFSEHTGGCVNLISSGTSSGESLFYDASKTGDDIFFITSSKLVSEDYDTGYDVYDAHACSSTVPCHVAPVLPPPCTSGDSCKVGPSPQPEIFGPAPSATFSGAGNVAASGAKPTVSPRALTRAQKLARALTACRRKRNRRGRAACEQQARKRYPAKQSHKAKATKKGDR
jgi:hypothetical protein